MKKLNDQIIIGVDHGYGNIKTANHCFRTGIQGILGHSDITTTMDIYTDVTEEMRNEAIEGFERYIDE